METIKYKDYDVRQIGGCETLKDFKRIREGEIEQGDIVLNTRNKVFEWAKGLLGASVASAAVRATAWHVFRNASSGAKKPLDVATAPPKALTYDKGKEPLAHLPWAAIDALAKTQAYGHKKYGDFNNYRKGMEVTRNLSCVLRHIRDYLNGSDKDHESGLNPLAHAFTRLAFVLQNMHDGVAIDDRFKKPTT